MACKNFTPRLKSVRGASTYSFVSGIVEIIFYKYWGIKLCDYTKFSWFALELSFYVPGKDFTCLDGSVTLPFSYVNDDYCDCPDGSDEPGKFNVLLNFLW